MWFQESEGVTDQTFTNKEEIERIKYVTNWGSAHSL